MAREIERKFLVHGERLPELEGGRRFVQGYLSEKPQVRFRVIGPTVVLCVKGRLSPRERLEFEFERQDMSQEEIAELCSLALWPPLTKTRYRVPYGDLVWEIDVYEDENEGLVTADVELPAADHPIAFPEWIDADSEITGVKRYRNINLTHLPFTKW